MRDCAGGQQRDSAGRLLRFRRRHARLFRQVPRRRPFQPNLWTGKPVAHQTIDQVWFSGVHTNVGGGYRNSGLSNIALEWLTSRASHHGLEFTEQIAGLSTEPAQNGRLENSFSLGYKLLRLLGVPPYAREIGTGQHGDVRGSDWVVPGEAVHPSARAAIEERFQGNGGDKPYEPRNLISALGAGLGDWAPRT